MAQSHRTLSQLCSSFVPPRRRGPCARGPLIEVLQYFCPELLQVPSSGVLCGDQPFRKGPFYPKTNPDTGPGADSEGILPEKGFFHSTKLSLLRSGFISPDAPKRLPKQAQGLAGLRAHTPGPRSVPKI